jgi:xanthine dehydrogenase small subunit
MIRFILNQKLVNTDSNAGMSLLDFIRYEANLSGTKIGCREGDCGACTVLIGELVNGKVHYQSITSCLYPLINAHGKHVVTIEGINLSNTLTPVQQVMADHAATQCGFCTPGFVMSFTAFCMNHEEPTTERAIEAVAGNICRCTGYKSIERAASDIARLMRNKNIADPIGWLVGKGYLPEYFLEIPQKLQNIDVVEVDNGKHTQLIAGGTDLMVQRPDAIYDQKVKSTLTELPREITVNNCTCTIGGATKVSDLLASAELTSRFPQLKDYLMLVSSEPIRNMATIAGNIVNASPIGDLSVMLLALNAQVTSIIDGKTRQQPLNELFIGYKQLNLNAGEVIQYITFELPKSTTQFSFEKVSKRKHLDIASVNSAMLIELDNGKVKKCRISAGGVAPIPLYLHRTSSHLIGKELKADTVAQATAIMQEEISPISDIRGAAEYKRLLLRQLFLAHLQKFLGDQFDQIFKKI